MDSQNTFLKTTDSSPTELGARILKSKAWVVFRQDDGLAHLHMSDESAVLLIGDLFVAYPHIEAQVMDYVRGMAQSK